MTDEDRTVHICHTHTEARRMPLSLGTLGSIVLPWPIPVMAGMVGLGVLVAMYLSRGLWEWMVSPMFRYAAYAVVPIGIGYAVRKLRPQGRSIFAFTHGWLEWKFTSLRPRSPGRQIRTGGTVTIIPSEEEA